MCELLGMSANVPTDICFSFSGLMVRGGQTAPHKDGFGVTFYEGKGSRTFKDALPSCESEIAKLIQSYPIKSVCVISHIRQANRGRVSLENTHPFSREMWGQNWTFAHNGQLKGVKKLTTDHFQPVGTTDSEHAFCWLMSQIKAKYPNKPPQDRKTLFRLVAKLAPTLHEMGVANFFLADGRYLFAHCSNNLHWLTRRAPFGVASLSDVEMTVDFQQETTPNDIVTVIATKPLTTNEDWYKMAPQEYQLFDLGEPIKL
ncbi:class II glutamine amidotransferase [Catenovulum sp. SM1970]|uniref:class II glutamine amidotransferase n=1 Tax=Marinifaba aquimaris TaxID=2741323 RepID=UPI00157231E0|nr:class II glutamine amidotransferase [Marinifaba aquimaris]NTS77281.1 class II glutamine amidotransferase [Marinifaba aquimaris]